MPPVTSKPWQCWAISQGSCTPGPPPPSETCKAAHFGCLSGCLPATTAPLSPTLPAPHPTALPSILLHLSLRYRSKTQPFQTPRLSTCKVATTHYPRLQLVPSVCIFQQALLFKEKNDQWINTNWLRWVHISFKFSPRHDERGNTVSGKFLPIPWKE